MTGKKLTKKDMAITIIAALYHLDESDITPNRKVCWAAVERIVKRTKMDDLYCDYSLAKKILLDRRLN